MHTPVAGIAALRLSQVSTWSDQFFEVHAVEWIFQRRG